MILERAPFSPSPTYLAALPSTLRSLKNLGANDIYYWYMACSSGPPATPPSNGECGDDEKTEHDDAYDDLKINLISPCTEQHLKKYSKQGARIVTETSAIYRDKIRPYIVSKREEGRLNWVWNIIAGKTEVEDVIFRTPLGEDVENGFLLLPDLNWDRKTMESLHLLTLVERRDMWSLRDLRKKHAGWLLELKRKILEATVKTYPSLEADQLKLYLHYQPTYYHLHIHVVHVALEAGATQATGKAVGLESIISQLRSMAGNEETGMDSVDMTYTIGEASELWTEIFEPLKRNYTASQQQ